MATLAFTTTKAAQAALCGGTGDIATHVAAQYIHHAKHQLLTQAADAYITTATTPIWTAYGPCTLLAAYLHPFAALTASDTNYTYVSLGKTDGAGGAITKQADLKIAITAGSGDLVVGVRKTLTNEAAAALAMTAGQQMIYYNSGNDAGGSGAVLTSCTVEAIIAECGS